MKKSILTLIVSAATMVSCSPPTVSRLITKSYPATAPDSPVEVYYSQEEIPQHSESLGLAQVRDNGFTATRDCDSTKVINLLKAEARKVGGNAVYVSEHVPPSAWTGTCHQMQGTLLRTSGEAVSADTAATPLAPAAEYVSNHVISPQRRYPRFRFELSGGYASRLGKDPEGLDAATMHYLNKLKSGFYTNASFDYFFNDYWGVGLTYAGFFARASAWGNNGETEGELLTTDNIHFIGPEVVARTPFSPVSHWSFEARYAFGYVDYNEQIVFQNITETTKGSTIGMQVAIGLEYAFAEWCGAFLQTQVSSGIINQLTRTSPEGHTETIKLEKEERISTGTVGVELGLRFYIK